MRTVGRWVFWTCLLLVVVATLGPIGLRPETELPSSVERWVAFLLVGLPLTIGYPRHRLAGLLALVLVAGGLEILQNAVPGRHGRWLDFDFKILGLLCGVGLGLLAERIAAPVDRP
ncbi:MAG TPA: VanZ family protein [Lichenihabitans sp.]|nr:VanZ family protein [Lichenihabitans sp.]